MDGFKTCIKCGEIKSINDFGKDKSKKSGYTGDCRKCRNDIARMKRKKTPIRRTKKRKKPKRKLDFAFYYEGIRVSSNQCEKPILDSDYTYYENINVFVDYKKVDAFFDKELGKYIYLKYKSDWHKIRLTSGKVRASTKWKIDINNDVLFLVNEHHTDIKYCPECNSFKPKTGSFFKKTKGGVRGGKQRYVFARICLNCETINNITRVCTSCDTRLPKTKEYFHQRKCKSFLNDGSVRKYDALRSICKKCFNEFSRHYKKEIYWQNIESARKRNRDNYWKDPEKSRAQAREWREHNIEKIKARDKKNIDELSDNYIKNTIRLQMDNAIERSEIPDGLIKLKRQSIKLKRLIKQKKNA